MDDKMNKKNKLNINGTNSKVQEVDIASEKFNGHHQLSEIPLEKTKNLQEENLAANNERQPSIPTPENMSKKDNDENAINDGADEQMLSNDDNSQLAEKRTDVNVKFIKGDHQNGDAKIDMGIANGKKFTGMTKEELMRYADDPFWVRLRWIFFVAFWAVWAAMLFGALLIIINTPKCIAPKPLSWYKQGPLASFNSLDSFTDDDVEETKRIQATGAIYELAPELTYSVSNPAVEEKIKNVIEKYKKSEINVILDVTPNYVSKDSIMFKEALADDKKRSPFIWIQQPQVPNNWVSVTNGTAWTEVETGNYVLSQFGDGLYDLHMNDTIVKKELEATLRHLVGLGIRGIRLKNTKFFLVSKNIQSEVPASGPGFVHTEYGFWTHTHTTFQEGLGDVLDEYSHAVKNSSSEAFLSVADDLLRPESYISKNGFLGIELPIYGRFLHYLGIHDGEKMQTELFNTTLAVGNGTWLQWNLVDLTKEEEDEKNPSAIVLYISLLPGVPVVPKEAYLFKNVSNETYKHVAHLRNSPSYMHGNFQLYASNQLVGYSRIKSGNPGYFVVYNPTDTLQTGNFTNMGLPEKMTVDSMSDNYNVSSIAVKSKPIIDSLAVSPYSTIILTYVPLKSD